MTDPNLWNDDWLADDQPDYQPPDTGALRRQKVLDEVMPGIRQSLSEAAARGQQAEIERRRTAYDNPDRRDHR